MGKCQRRFDGSIIQSSANRRYRCRPPYHVSNHVSTSITTRKKSSRRNPLSSACLVRILQTLFDPRESTRQVGRTGLREGTITLHYLLLLCCLITTVSRTCKHAYRQTERETETKRGTQHRDKTTYAAAAAAARGEILCPRQSQGVPNQQPLVRNVFFVSLNPHGRLMVAAGETSLKAVFFFLKHHHRHFKYWYTYTHACSIATTCYLLRAPKAKPKQSTPPPLPSKKKEISHPQKGKRKRKN